MPALENARHEKFVQELTKGKTQEQAYIDAGYSENGAEVSASQLLRNPKVAARVAELQEKAANKAVIDKAMIVQRLLGLADKGEQLAEAPGLSVSRASLMDVAKLLGMIVEKNENSGPNGGPMQFSVVTGVERKDD
jgi:hypothetical protein